MQELLLALLRVAHAEVGEPLRESLDVLVCDVDEEARRFRDVVVGELAREAEVDEPDQVGPDDEDVRRVRVAVEEPVPEDHRHPRLRDHLGQPLALLHRVARLVDVGQLAALDELERQDAGTRVRPVDARDADVRVAGEVAMERLGVAPLEPVVELLADRACEFVHELAHVDEVERPDALLGDTRRLVEETEVGLDLLRRARSLHLDGDDVAVREHRTVDLADRGRGQRLAVEFEEETLDRLAELLADDALDLFVRERAHVVLEPAQLGDDVRRQHVGPHREELAELDEGRAELVEELAEVLAALRRRAVDDPRAVPAAREKVGQLVALEEVAEAVPDGDLGDLRQPAEVARLRWSFSHDPKCSTPVPEALVTRDCPCARDCP